MPQTYANNTMATVTSGGTTTTDTSWTVNYTSGFPTTWTGPFHVVDTAVPTEKIKVTAISGTGPYTWTVTRGDEGSTAVAHAAGFTVEQVVTAGDFGSFLQAGYRAGSGPGGTALANGTPTFASWTAPNDGQVHRVVLFSDLIVTSTETGGLVNATYTDPGGTARTQAVYAAALAAGYNRYGQGTFLIAPNSTFSLVQGSALTAGAAVMHYELWAA